MDRNRLKMLVDEGKSISQIAEVMGITKTPVRYWLKKHGLATRCQSGETTRSWSDSDMKKALAASDTVAGALRSLGLSLSNGNYLSVRKFIRRSGVDVSHMKGKAHGGGGHPKIPMDDILVENSTYDRTHLKRRLIKEGVLEEECNICGQGVGWNGLRLKMVLDHINGVPDDNRIENLRLLCPNCNSQQDTFSRGSKKMAVLV